MKHAKKWMLSILAAGVILLLAGCGKIEADPLADAQAMLDGTFNDYIGTAAQQIAQAGVVQDNIFGTVSHISDRLQDSAVFENTAEVYAPLLAEEMKLAMQLSLGEAAVDQGSKTATVELQYNRLDALALAGAAQYFSKVYFTDGLWFEGWGVSLEECCGSKLDKVCASMLERLPAEAKSASTFQMSFQYDGNTKSWVCDNAEAVEEALFTNRERLGDAEAVTQSAKTNFPCPYEELPIACFTFVLPMDVVSAMPDVVVTMDSNGINYTGLSYNGETTADGTVLLLQKGIKSGGYGAALEQSAQLFSLMADDVEKQDFTGNYLQGAWAGTAEYKMYDYYYDLTPLAESYSLNEWAEYAPYLSASTMYKEEADFAVLDECVKQAHPFALYPEWYE